MLVIEKYPHLFLSLLFALLLVAGCGGGGGGSSAPAAAADSNASTEEGELIIGITDAPGDFVTYTVTVTGLTLTRSNGDVIETLPNETRIDFNELTEVTEFLSIATVPAGTYQTATITLDYTDADILVQNELGDAVLATVTDEQGNPLGTIAMTLTLTGSDVIRIQPGTPAAFSLDFDLDASNTIDLTSTPAVVTVEPFLLATAELETDREHRARGVLDDVDTAANTFDLQIRPFHHRSGRFGELTVNVDADTEYDVDGVGFTGSSGLEALAALADGAPVVTLGQVADQTFTADIVVAGSSVPWSDADVIRGVVTARDNQSMTVRGAFADLANGSREFRGTYTVQVTDDTTVSAPGSSNVALSPQSISVGQPILAWGEVTDDNTLVAERIRLQYAQLTGEVVETSPLVSNLSWLNGRHPEIYTFSGTGVTPADDADPQAYDIDTATLPLSSLEIGDLVRVRGLVNEFGAAPADFNAKTVVDVQTDLRAAVVKVGWPEGSSTPFVSTAPDRLDVDLSAARAALKMHGVPLGFIELMDQLALIGTEAGVYAVKIRGSRELHLYRSFEDLVAALVAELDSGHALHRITASGRYNTQLSELTTGRAGFVFATTQETE